MLDESRKIEAKFREMTTLELIGFARLESQHGHLTRVGEHATESNGKQKHIQKLKVPRESSLGFLLRDSRHLDEFNIQIEPGRASAVKKPSRGRSTSRTPSRQSSRERMPTSALRQSSRGRSQTRSASARASSAGSAKSVRFSRAASGSSTRNSGKAKGKGTKSKPRGTSANRKTRSGSRSISRKPHQQGPRRRWGNKRNPNSNQKQPKDRQH